MTAAERMKQYEELFAQSQAYNPAKFQQDFESQYQQAANYNQDLIGQKSGYIEQAQALPAQLREQYYSSPIRNPLAQEALIAQRRGSVVGDISRVTDLLGQRGARYQDVLGKHLQGYLADQQAAERAAENAWRMYQDAQAREEAERARRAAAAQAFDWSKLFSGGATSGGGRIEVEDWSPTQHKVEPQYQRLLDAGSALVSPDRNNKGTILGNLSNYIKSSGWNVLNPIHAIGSSTVALRNLFNR
jgi:hypothetical protein